MSFIILMLSKGLLQRHYMYLLVVLLTVSFWLLFKAVLLPYISLNLIFILPTWKMIYSLRRGSNFIEFLNALGDQILTLFFKKMKYYIFIVVLMLNMSKFISISCVYFTGIQLLLFVWQVVKGKDYVLPIFVYPVLSIMHFTQSSLMISQMGSSVEDCLTNKQKRAFAFYKLGSDFFPLICGFC